jgi:hypothetical protein
MRVSSRIVAAFLAAAVWIYAGMSVASRPTAQQAITPSVLGATANGVLPAID